jgi:hypothetical protein
MGEAAGIFTKLLGESGLWTGIGKKLEAVFLNLRATLLETFADVKESLPSWMGGGKDGPSEENAAEVARLQAQRNSLLAQQKDNERWGNADVAKSLAESLANTERRIQELSGLRAGADLARQGAAAASAEGNNAIASVDAKGIVSAMAESLGNTGAAFSAGYARAGQAIPTDPIQLKLDELIAGAKFEFPPLTLELGEFYSAAESVKQSIAGNTMGDLRERQFVQTESGGYSDQTLAQELRRIVSMSDGRTLDEVKTPKPVDPVAIQKMFDNIGGSGRNQADLSKPIQDLSGGVTLDALLRAIQGLSLAPSGVMF